MSDSPNDPFARFFAESRTALQRYVRRLVRSRETASEIVQEAFMRTYEHGDRVETPRAFLFSTARNLASDHRRRERLAATDSVASYDDPRIAAGCGPLEDLLIADESSRLLKEAIERLPPQCRAAFTLKVFEGCSYREIGEKLGLSPKTVEKHIARGLLGTHRYLRARYSQYGVACDEHDAPRTEAHEDG